MAKVTNSELAKLVAKKNKLAVKGVENFLSTMFDVIDEGLHADRIVKVKGLGTFKITEVKQRESVNVNTGERVIIDGHSKVSFTPDAAMKELVNKPFAQFETVVVNDNVDVAVLEKVDEPAEEPVEEQEPQTAPVAAVADIAPKKTEEPKAAEPTQEKPLAAETKKEVVAAETKKESVAVEPTEKAVPIEPEKKESLVAENPSDDVPGKQNNWMMWLLAALLALLCFGLGYWMGSGKASSSDKKAEEVKAVQADTLAKDSVVASSPVSDFDKLNADPRLKGLYYDIVGIDTIVTLREGQTMRSYCNATLGNQMLIYFQVLNGVDEMGGGEKLKVPKVKPRKKH